MYNDLANNFLLEENIKVRAEILAQMSKVIENTDTLMNMGVAFTSAVTATNEVAETFPPLIEQKKFDKTKLIESIKQIENNSHSKSEDFTNEED